MEKMYCPGCPGIQSPAAAQPEMVTLRNGAVISLAELRFSNAIAAEDYRLGTHGELTGAYMDAVYAHRGITALVPTPQARPASAETPSESPPA